MLNEARVQSLVNLNLSKFFTFREHVQSAEELDGLATMIFTTMAKEVCKRHEITKEEYLEQVFETLKSTRKTDKRLTHEYWVAWADFGWMLAFTPTE